MTLDIKIFLLCPIPEDQKPINEYIDFKENILKIIILFMGEIVTVATTCFVITLLGLGLGFIFLQVQANT